MQIYMSKITVLLFVPLAALFVGCEKDTTEPSEVTAQKPVVIDGQEVPADVIDRINRLRISDSAKEQALREYMENK